MVREHLTMHLTLAICLQKIQDIQEFLVPVFELVQIVLTGSEREYFPFARTQHTHTQNSHTNTYTHNVTKYEPCVEVRQSATLSYVGFGALHRVCLAGTRLSVGEDAHVISVHHGGYRQAFL